MKSAAVRATTRRAAAVASDAANGASRWRSNARRRRRQQQQRRQPSRSRSSRSFSSIWLWTATTCLVGTRTSTTTTTTNPFWLSRLPVASAFSIHAIRGGGGGGASRGFGGLPAAVATGKRSTTSLGAARSFTTHSSLSELLREFDYDALILDQFGVLHNGKHPLEGTVECVDRIAGGGGSERTDDDDDDGAPKEDNEKKKKKKLRLIVLSNTSSPSETTLDRLETKLGFDRSLFCGAVTSGEEAARHVRETYGTPRSDDDDDDDPRTGSERRRRFVWCTWDPSNENVPDPLAFLDLCGPNVEPTVDVSAADFVIAHGSGAIRGFGGGDDRRDGAGGEERHEIRSMGGFMDDGNLAEGTPISDLLEECAERNLPLICANPDMVVQYHDGSLKHMPGRIAERYREILEARDGDDDGEPSSSSSSSLITIYGKPHGEHFEACLRELEEDRARDEEAVRREDDDDDDSAGRRRPLKVAHVGDSLHHDIAGANAAGIPSIFVVGGIHAEELLGPRGDDDDGGVMPSEERLREFFDREGIAPTHVLPVFNY